MPGWKVEDGEAVDVSITVTRKELEDCVEECVDKMVALSKTMIDEVSYHYSAFLF
jgi:hypothetical protein